MASSAFSLGGGLPGNIELIASVKAGDTTKEYIYTATESCIIFATVSAYCDPDHGHVYAAMSTTGETIFRDSYGYSDMTLDWNVAIHGVFKLKKGDTVTVYYDAYYYGWGTYALCKVR